MPFLRRLLEGMYRKNGRIIKKEGGLVWPCGQVAKVPCALPRQLGFAGLDPGHGPTPLISHAVEASHMRSRGRLAQQLAQGKSFSSKKEESWQQIVRANLLHQKKKERGTRSNPGK